MGEALDPGTRIDHGFPPLYSEFLGKHIPPSEANSFP